MSLTESLHPKTENIDKVSVEKGVQLIAGTYDEMFDALNSDKSHIMGLKYRFDEYKDLIKIIAGSGTSGRWAEFIARKYPGFLSMMAGGPTTLLKAKEGAEDQPLLGIRDFRNININEGYYLNVSCSGRDKYSMGPVYDILRNFPNFNVGMITFNGIIHMSEENLPGMDTSIRSLVERVELFNPKIGPEPIAGSTRMKGGSATQIMLEAAINGNFENYSWNKRNLPELKKIIMDAAESLADKKRLHYIGEDNQGIIAVMDAAECPPTFGSRFEDVRAFINHGWYGLLSQKQLSKLDYVSVKKNPIDLESFKEIVQEGDTVVNVSREDFSSKLYATLNHARNRGAKTHHLVEGDEASLKILLNIISTETFVQLGHTYKNLMINLRLSNQKLINRAIDIIIPEVHEDIVGSISGKQRIVGTLNHVAGKYLGKSFGNGLLTPKIYYEVEKIVPTALLVLLGMDYASARKELGKEIYIRDVLNKNL